MLNIVKTCVQRVSRSLGYDIVPLREIRERDFALHLGELMRHLEIDCVLDVGADTGQYHDFLRDKVRFEGTIVSFEPVTGCVAQLRVRAQHDPDWHIEPYALGAKDASLAIKVTAANPVQELANVRCRTETVAVKTVDWVLPKLRQRHGFRRPYLKLRTRGFDIDVLEGAHQSLPGIPALQSEASALDICKGMSGNGMPSYLHTIGYLGSRGFDITGFYPVTRDRSLRLIEFDCVMINRTVAAAAA